MRLLLCCLLCSTLITLQAKESIQIQYYGQTINLDYDPAMVFQWRVCAKDRCIKEFYEKMEENGPHQTLLDNLLSERDRMALNDWMYYVLVRKAVEQLYADIKTDKEEMPQTTATWYLLNKSGYNVDLANAALKHLFIMAPSKKKLYGIGRSSMKRGWYAYNISAHYLKINAKLAALSMNKFDPDPKEARFMDLSFQQHPKLGNPTITLEIPLKHQDTTYQLAVEIDTMITHYMKDHPKMKQEEYMTLPLSNPLANSLLPQLQEILRGKSPEEAMSVLLSFTRRSFKYKWDWDIYDEDHSIIADRVFLEPYSDHEDKSALFCYLVRQLYGYQMAVISHFNFDITIGVALEKPVGSPYTIDEVAYTICDPTSPTNSGKVGRYPNGFTDKTAELLRILDPVTPNWPVPALVVPALVEQAEPPVVPALETIDKTVSTELTPPAGELMTSGLSTTEETIQSLISTETDPTTEALIQATEPAITPVENSTVEHPQVMSTETDPTTETQIQATEPAITPVEENPTVEHTEVMPTETEPIIETAMIPLTDSTAAHTQVISTAELETITTSEPIPTEESPETITPTQDNSQNISEVIPPTRKDSISDSNLVTLEAPSADTISSSLEAISTPTKNEELILKPSDTESAPLPSPPTSQVDSINLIPVPNPDSLHTTATPLPEVESTSEPKVTQPVSTEETKKAKVPSPFEIREDF